MGEDEQAQAGESAPVRRGIFEQSDHSRLPRLRSRRTPKFTRRVARLAVVATRSVELDVRLGGQARSSGRTAIGNARLFRSLFVEGGRGGGRSPFAVRERRSRRRCSGPCGPLRSGDAGACTIGLATGAQTRRCGLGCTAKGDSPLPTRTWTSRSLHARRLSERETRLNGQFVTRDQNKPSSGRRSSLDNLIKRLHQPGYVLTRL